MMVNCLVAELPASFQVMSVLPSMRNPFARCWMASTSEIVKPVMKSPRAMSYLPFHVALRPRASMWTKPDEG